MYRIVIDTNVIIAALRSKHGASNQLLRLLGTNQFEHVVSVPLVLEYEEVCKRQLPSLNLSENELEGFIDYLCKVSFHRKIFYLWRPTLRDADDDFLLDLAVKAQVDFIVTFNTKDFRGVEKFNVKLTTPKEFMQILGVLP
jgi:putative PIN family toxin of toxin-antitoxin system